MTALAMRPRVDAFAVERRRHARVRVCLTGQFMRENRKEFPCTTIDVSVGGIAFTAEEQVQIGEKIIAYITQIGRVQGIVRRVMPAAFAIAMTLPQLKRERLADQLTWIANRHELGMPEDRRHERIAPRIPGSTLTLPDGRQVLCKIIDISRSGVGISVAFAPPVGVLVTVGQTRGQVVREFNDGIAIEFTRIIPPEAFGPDYRL